MCTFILNGNGDGDPCRTQFVFISDLSFTERFRFNVTHRANRWDIHRRLIDQLCRDPIHSKVNGFGIPEKNICLIESISTDRVDKFFVAILMWILTHDKIKQYLAYPFHWLWDIENERDRRREKYGKINRFNFDWTVTHRVSCTTPWTKTQWYAIKWIIAKNKRTKIGNPW